MRSRKYVLLQIDMQVMDKLLVQMAHKLEEDEMCRAQRLRLKRLKKTIFL